jgi:hypothetical protein
VRWNDDLIQCEVRSLGKDLLGLQQRTASAARPRFASPARVKCCIHLIRGTEADVELVEPFPPGTSCFNKADDRPSQFTRIRSGIGWTRLHPVSWESRFSRAGDMM